MENTKEVGGSGSSSSLKDLFGPKNDSSSSPPGLFGSVFGPQSTGLGKDSSVRKQDSGSQYGKARNGTSENITQRGKDKRSNIYQSEAAEPCYFSSSIYYGGQEVYSPTSQPTVSQHIFEKDGGNEDPNGSYLTSASRGNWWQGSLYY